MIGAIGLATLSGCGRAKIIGRPAASKVVVVSQVEEAANAGSGVLACNFTLANKGDQDLRLGAITTSCGCTSAEVIPKTVPPGGKAVLSAEGHPPLSGTTPVQIRVNTNDPDLPTLTLNWKLVGNPSPPSLLTPSPIIELGILRPGRAVSPRSFGFDVLEKRESPPIVQGIRFDPSFCLVEGGMTDEMPAKDPRLVTRSYRYDVNFLSIPGVGQLAHQIELLRTSDEAIPWMVVPIRGRVLPIVRVVPASIPLVDRKTDPNASARFMIVCDDQSGSLEVDCIDHDLATIVRVVERQSDRVFFEVYQEGVGDHSAIRPLRFRVSQPVTTTLEVPIQAKNSGSSPP